MPPLTFSKWSSGGNTTIFLHAAGPGGAYARAVLSPHILGAEQAGTVCFTPPRLVMAGGEFCVNASRAFGALLALREPAQAAPFRTEIRVSGWQGPVRLRVRGAAPGYEVEARLSLPPGTGPTTAPAFGPGARLVRLPGISHLLLPLADFPLPEDVCRGARAALDAAGLLGEAAAGVVWWRPLGDAYAMTPVVHVRGAGSLVAENACGSGALALALELAARGGAVECAIAQPSGSVLHARVDARDPDGRVEAAIDGPVTLLARGRVWLDAADAEN